MRISDWSSDVCSSDLRTIQIIVIVNRAGDLVLGRSVSLLAGQGLDPVYIAFGRIRREIGRVARVTSAMIAGVCIGSPKGQLKTKDRRRYHVHLNTIRQQLTGVDEIEHGRAWLKKKLGPD